MQHLDEGTIHAWLDGALPADEAAGVERHARECAECAALVADARGVIAGVARIVSALDDVPAGVVPKPSRASQQRSVWRTLRLTPLRAALAASLMVFAASLAVIRHAPRDAALPMQSAPAAAAPTSAVAPVAAPPAPVTETKPAMPKVHESRRESVASDTSITVRDVVSNSAVADSINHSVAKPLAEAARRVDATAEAAKRVEPKAIVSAPQGANAPVVVDVTGATRSVDAQLRPTATRSFAQPFRMMLTSADNRPLVLPGCYQLVRDTTGLVPLPERFSLESDGDASARRNVVRALTADGRRDSVMAGVTWVTSGVNVGVIVTRDGPVVAALARQAAPSARVQVARGIDINGQLNRIDCR